MAGDELEFQVDPVGATRYLVVRQVDRACMEASQSGRFPHLAAMMLEGLLAHKIDTDGAYAKEMAAVRRKHGSPESVEDLDPDARNAYGADWWAAMLKAAARAGITWREDLPEGSMDAPGEEKPEAVGL